MLDNGKSEERRIEQAVCVCVCVLVGAGVGVSQGTLSLTDLARLY